MLVYCEKKLNEDIGDVKDRHKPDRPRSGKTPQAINTRSKRNHFPKQKIMSGKM